MRLRPTLQTDPHDTPDFYQHLAALAGGPRKTHLERLTARGFVFPNSAELVGVEITVALHLLIRGLAEIGVFLAHTNHLSNRDLYVELVDRVLPHTVELPGTSPTTISLVPRRSQAGTEIWLAYHASDREREIWEEMIGPVPPKRLPRSCRDDVLPRPSDA